MVSEGALEMARLYARMVHADTYSATGSLYGGSGCECEQCNPKGETS